MMTIFFPVLTIHGEKHAIVKPLLTEPKDTQFWIDTLKRQVIFVAMATYKLKLV